MKKIVLLATAFICSLAVMNWPAAKPGSAMATGTICGVNSDRPTARAAGPTRRGGTGFSAHHGSSACPERRSVIGQSHA